jgi:formylglycine-generating enzyme
MKPIVSAFFLCVMACSGRETAPSVPAEPGPTETPPADSPNGAVPPALGNGGTPSSPPAASNSTEEGSAEPNACAEGMVLIDDEYCTEVEHTCREEWYAKANKKRVCEDFEPVSRCTGERVEKRYCIDEYSWPNEKGVRAEVMNNFYQAQVKCAAVGKRMCTESEWTMACEGPRLLPFPYGYKRDVAKCNGDREWDQPNMEKVAARNPEELARLWQGVPEGSQPECKSEYGVYDLPGNSDDLASSETYGSDYRGKFDNVTTGGPWYKGVRNQCRPKIYTHNEGFYYYYLSFRCCAEADGKETDPRAPKQIKRDWEFERVEKLARFTREQVREKLELKKHGKCECGPKDALCKTMCGTLLGPSAKDVVLGVPNAPAP